MFNLFTPSRLFLEASANWIEACFAWASEYFDGERFAQQTRLIQPTNKDFPGRVDSPNAMAATVLNHVVNYSGLNHWPLRLAHVAAEPVPMPPLLALNPNQRGATMPANTWAEDEVLPVFPPGQCKQPGDLAATFATLVAQHMMFKPAKHRPVVWNFSNAAEVLAVFFRLQCSAG